MALEVRDALVGGRRIRYRAAGAGAPVVLVHGLSGSWRWWVEVAEALAERYDIRVVDVPRFGRSFAPGNAAAWLADFVAAETGRAHVVGHSLGGLVAAQVAARRPELVDRLVLAAPTGVPSRRPVVGYARPLVDALLTAPPTFLRTLAGDALRAGPEALVRGALYATREDARADAGAIRAATLLVWGDRDPLVPFRLADAWREAIPTARLEVLHGVGHVPMVDAPGAFAAAVRDFLA